MWLKCNIKNKKNVALGERKEREQKCNSVFLCIETEVVIQNKTQRMNSCCPFLFLCILQNDH